MKQLELAEARQHTDTHIHTYKDIHSNAQSYLA